jgi:hypothetical protein
MSPRGQGCLAGVLGLARLLANRAASWSSPSPPTGRPRRPVRPLRSLRVGQGDGVPIRARSPGQRVVPGSLYSWSSPGAHLRLCIDAIPDQLGNRSDRVTHARWSAAGTAWRPSARRCSTPPAIRGSRSRSDTPSARMNLMISSLRMSSFREPALPAGTGGARRGRRARRHTHDPRPPPDLRGPSDDLAQRGRRGRAARVVAQHFPGVGGEHVPAGLRRPVVPRGRGLARTPDRRRTRTAAADCQLTRLIAGPAGRLCTRWVSCVKKAAGFRC